VPEDKKDCYKNIVSHPAVTDVKHFGPLKAHSNWDNTATGESPNERLILL